MKRPKQIRDDLPEQGRKLLRLIVKCIRSVTFKLEDPNTYLGYKGCCVALKAAPKDANIQWGRLLQRHGLTDLNEWSKRHNLPRISGLIVNQTEDSVRQHMPGGDYFKSNGRSDMDMDWWKSQVKAAAAFNWAQYV